MKKLIISISLAILIASSSTQAAVLLSDQTYLKQVENTIKEAQESVYVLMYFINLRFEREDDPVFRLVNSLVKAKNRKVEVKVVLEDNVQKVSLKAFNLLSKNKVAAAFDTPLTFIHDKLIVVDKNICIIASHNWSRAALSTNSETGILIRSPALAAKLIEKIEKIPLGRKVVPSEAQVTGIRIPYAFLLKQKKGAPLVSHHAEKAFDLYLILLRDFKDWKIPIKYEKWAKELGYDRERLADLPSRQAGKTSDYYKYYYNIVIKDIATPLDKKYGLIRYLPRTKVVRGLPKSGYIKLLSLKDPKQFYKIPQRLFIEIPNEYWEYSWDKKLSLRAKYLYLINLLETKRSVAKPWWWRSQENISKIYGISTDTISKGLIELRRANLIEIQRSLSLPGEPFKERLANYYRLNPLYSRGNLEKDFDKLKDKYGSTIFDQAQELADQLNEPNQISIIETFVGLINKYGYDKVKEANQETAKLSIHNPKRHVGYTINILR